jgi:sugar lactone lactonase YvrE
MAVPAVGALSPSGKLVIADGLNPRVLIWNSFPTTNGAPADVVLGQVNFTDNILGTTASMIKHSWGVAFSPDGAKLLAADFGNHRVLIWNTIPTANNTPADVVIGQTDLVTGTPGTSATKMNGPVGITVTPDGKLFVGDFNNDRVLIFNSIPTTNGAAADVVVGQPNMTTTGSGAGANQMNGPWNVAVAPSGKMVVSDDLNRRALVFNSVPTSNGASADVVIGQTGFGLTNSGVSATAVAKPTGVTVSSSGQLALCDANNNRVLIYNTIPTTHGAAADVVLGQPNFTSAASGLTTHSMSVPYGVQFIADGRLLVGGHGMQRMMVFGTAGAFVAPTVTTDTQSAVTHNSATLGGNVTADGGASVTERGIVWGLAANPTTADTKVANGSGTGTFTATVNGLPAGSTIHVRAYATNSVDTSYGTDISFNTPPAVAVTSLNIANASPTNAAFVNWTLTFPSAVNGLTASNFTLSGAAAAGSGVASPGTSNGGLTWTIPVSTGSTDGTLTLNLANATGLSAAISTSLPFAGQSYTMDKTPPTVQSVTRLTPLGQNTNATTVTFRVTYSEPVSLNNPETARFQVVPVNGSTIVGTVTGVTGTTNTRDVTVNLTSGVGEFKLRVLD